MRAFALRTSLVVAGLAALFAVPTVASATGSSGVVPVAPEQPANPAVGIEQKLGAQVPLDLVFRDESEQPITVGQAMQGKVTILVPAYYRCPMLCTRVLNGLLDGVRSFPADFSAGNQFTILTVSMDPKEHADLGHQKKAHYLAEYGRLNHKDPHDPGWRFLTGGKESIATLLDAVGYRYEFDKAFKEYNHPSGIIILTPDGKVSRYFLGIGYDDKDANDPTVPRDANGNRIGPPTWKTLKLSLVEASGGKIGTLADQLTLVCYRFDALSNGYALNVLRAVQIGGILVLLTMGAGVTIALRRERRRLAAETAAASAGGVAAPNHLQDGPPPSGGTT